MSTSKPQDFRPPQAQAQIQPQSQAPGQQQTQPQRLPQTGIQNSQTDGASDDLSDWKAEVQWRREAAAKNGPENDRRLRDLVESRNLQLEGGGLLAPLHERYPHANGKKRKIVKFDDLDSLSNQTGASSVVPTSNTTTEAPSHPQFDGPDDYPVKKDDDEDAINSDLDDPDDLLDEDQGEDDAVGQVMLCTYDKVQRVKSKWKCVLKDGILTSDGKECVSSSASFRTFQYIFSLTSRADTYFTKERENSNGINLHPSSRPKNRLGLPTVPRCLTFGGERTVPFLSFSPFCIHTLLLVSLSIRGTVSRKGPPPWPRLYLLRGFLVFCIPMYP